MHGIKDPDVKELTDTTNEEEEEEEDDVEVKEDAKVRHLSSVPSRSPGQPVFPVHSHRHCGVTA